MPSPEPKAAPPAEPTNPAPNKLGNMVPPSKLPNIAPTKASGCPVCGFMVTGMIEANPATSCGLTCISIVSP